MHRFPTMSYRKEKWYLWKQKIRSTCKVNHQQLHNLISVSDLQLPKHEGNAPTNENQLNIDRAEIVSIQTLIMNPNFSSTIGF